MNPDLFASYRQAQAVARSRARNFYYSFVVLPPEKRRAFCAIYAFMRYCDDISDGGESSADKLSQLRRWRAQLDLDNPDACPINPILPAFRDSVRKYDIPLSYFHWIIDGAEMDLSIDRYRTFQDLYQYCFNVASAVGLVCLQIFGFEDEQAKKYAEYCGIAFQLTNILRDVKEDAQMGRIYLPQEDLQKFSYSPEDLLRGIVDDRFRGLMRFEAERAHEHYAQACKLLPLVEPVSRPALWAMIEIYRRILDKIIACRYEVFGKPIRLSNPEKAAIALKALALRFISY